MRRLEVDRCRCSNSCENPTDFSFVSFFSLALKLRAGPTTWFSDTPPTVIKF